MKYAYRPDIDGLRAISVLLVLFFHAGIFGIKAGFIGVDIFFVISGFLITTGIKNGLEKGTFSFIEFYKKRLWRLQPVFITLLLVTTIVTSLTYLPDDYLNFTKSAKWATRFQSNKYFSGLDTGYFAEDTSILPLLHTWSLSVEWQWYLLLPFLMFGFYRILRIKKLAYWVFPLTLIMIAVAFYALGDRSSPYYYYSFVARIFEMLIGSCLAAVGIKGVDKIPSAIKTALGLICLAVIFYAAFSEKAIHLYPNWWAVVVCSSGAILIYIGGGTKSNIITKILSLKPLAFIGLISYSLYIWHWPVFAFIRNLAIEETWIVTAVALVISFVLACLSYQFIEDRFRKKHTLSLWKTLLILLVIPYILICILDSQNKKHEGFSGRFSEEYHGKNAELISVLGKDIKDTVGDLSSSRKILLVGDSHANHAIRFFDYIGRIEHYSVEVDALPACLNLPDIRVTSSNSNVQSNAKKCSEKVGTDYIRMSQHQYDYVVISQSWGMYFLGHVVYTKQPDLSTDEAIEYALDELLTVIEKSGATPVIVSPVQNFYSGTSPYPPYNRLSGYCAMAKQKKHFLFSSNCDFKDERTTDAIQIKYNEIFKRMQKKHSQLIIIDLSAIQCNKGICRSEINGYPVYRDRGDHITDYASYAFGKEYLEKYGNPFKQ